MTYTIKSENLEVPNKKMGDKVTEQELLDLGANIDALVSGGHISSDSPKQNATPFKPVIVEEGDK